MYGKWNDILVNAKWTHKKDGLASNLLFHIKTQEKGERKNFILVYIDHFGSISLFDYDKLN